MKIAVVKILDTDKNVIGYKTSGLQKELYINMFIEEETAEYILSKIAEMKKIPDEISGITNVVIKTKQEKSRVLILLPDECGNYNY